MTGPSTSHTGGPVFMVGPSRSGTALTRAILNRSPEVSLAGETHYFDDLRIRLGEAATSGLDEAQRAETEDYFLRLSHRPYGHAGNVEDGWLDRETLRTAAQAHGTGGDAYFEAFCRLFAARTGATRWGEKTPRHVFRIDDILDRYPDASVVGLVRDPRAVVLSYRDWKVDHGGFEERPDATSHAEALAVDETRARRSYHPALLALLWRSQASALLGASRRSPERFRLVHYETLVAQPDKTVEELAAWLGIRFEPAMLDVPVLNSSFSRFDADGGITTDATDRWRTRLSTSEIDVVQRACGSLLTELGYEPEPTTVSPRSLLPWVTLPAAALRSIGANRSRMAAVMPYVGRRVRVLLSGGRP